MIIVKIMGGLGNQMFQYATARRLANKNGAELKLDTTGYANMAKEDTPRRYELDVFKIKAKLATAQDLARVKPADYQRKFYEKIKHKLGVSEAIYYYGERSAGFDPKVLALKDNTYLVGWWQNAKYFKDIRGVLLKEFQPAKPLSKYSQSILKKIEAAPLSVAVHVRRGDYVANKHANKFHGLTPLEYYRAAAEYFQKRFSKLLFVVFSDDIKWCQQNLDFGKNTIFIKPPPGRHDYEDILLMSACNHAVVANSSFSWWGAWLNDNPGKIIVAPKIWFQDPKANAETDIVPKNWVRL